MGVAELEKLDSAAVVPPELTIYQAIECLRHFECQQNPQEIEALCNLVRGKSSMLEIGSNFGGSLRRMGEALAPNSRIVSVDLPEPRHRWVDPLTSLKFNCQELANMGHRVELIVGSSHETLCQSLVRKHAPYDFIFIDGDHSYEGVKKDWEDYNDMAPIVGFHDVAGGTEGCVRFWKELKKAHPEYRFEEFDFPRQLVTTGDWLKLGVGIVYKEG